MHLKLQFSVLDWELLVVNWHRSYSHSGTLENSRVTACNLVLPETLLYGSRSLPSLQISFGSPAVTRAAPTTRHPHKSTWADELCPGPAGPLSPWYAPSRVILMTCNCNGLELDPAMDKELAEFPQNSVGSRMKPQDHVFPAVMIRQYCVIVINTIARQESCCHTSTEGKNLWIKCI